MKKRGKLTLVQKKALVSLSTRGIFVPKETEFQWPTIANLKALRFVNALKDGTAGMGPMAECVVSPKGHKKVAELKGKGII